MPAQLGICDFEGIQPATTQRGEQAKFLPGCGGLRPDELFSDRGGVIVYYARNGVGRGALCFAVKIFYISINIPYWVFEGGLLCLKN